MPTPTRQGQPRRRRVHRRERQAAAAGLRGRGREAARRAQKARGYLPIDGIAAYDKAVQGLVFGADSDVVQQGRVATIQALGGTGGLKVGADFLKRLRPTPRC
jgi:aspartate/tyrosine/aromatic aminotransferase